MVPKGRAPRQRCRGQVVEKNAPFMQTFATHRKEAVMTRAAFSMKLKPGFEAEYKKRHDEIWPALVKELEDAGISDYSIYLDEASLTLFAFQKVKDHGTSGQLPSREIVKKWWKYMADLMETNPDSSPKVTTLREVFHMD
jgi:L-rhamnose mutarotase